MPSELPGASRRPGDNEYLNRILARKYGYLGPVDEEPVVIEEVAFGHLVFCRCCGFDGIALTTRRARDEQYRHINRCPDALYSMAMQGEL